MKAGVACALIALLTLGIMPGALAYQLQDGWIYYEAPGVGSCRMRSNGTDAKCLIPREIQYGYLLCASDSALYATETIGGTGGDDGPSEQQLLRFDIGGGNRKQLLRYTDTYDGGGSQLDGGVLYISARENSSCVLLRVDTASGLMLSSLPLPGPDSAFQIADGWIYFNGSDIPSQVQGPESRRIYRMRTDGSECSLFLDAEGTGYIASNWQLARDVLTYQLHTQGEDVDPVGDGLFSMDLRTREIERIGDDLTLIAGGWAYSFVSEDADADEGNGDCVLRNLATGEMHIVPGVNDWAPLDVCAGWLFYYDMHGNGPLMRRLEPGSSGVPVPLTIQA